MYKNIHIMPIVIMHVHVLFLIYDHSIKLIADWSVKFAHEHEAELRLRNIS